MTPVETRSTSAAARGSHKFHDPGRLLRGSVSLRWPCHPTSLRLRRVHQDRHVTHAGLISWFRSPAVPPTQASLQGAPRSPCHSRRPHFRVLLDVPTGASIVSRACARRRFGAGMGSGDRRRPTSWVTGDLTHPCWLLRCGGPAVFVALGGSASAPQMGDRDGSLWAPRIRRRNGECRDMFAP